MPTAVSVKKLRAAFPALSVEDAKAIHAGMKHGGSERGVEATLELVSSKIGGHGVEVIRGSHFRRGYWADAVLVYANTGDTYDTTVHYEVDRDRYSVGSWGDWVEWYERTEGESLP
jgi:hypothetical protein